MWALSSYARSALRCQRHAYDESTCIRSNGHHFTKLVSTQDTGRHCGRDEEENEKITFSVKFSFKSVSLVGSFEAPPPASLTTFSDMEGRKEAQVVINDWLKDRE